MTSLAIVHGKHVLAARQSFRECCVTCVTSFIQHVSANGVPAFLLFMLLLIQRVLVRCLIR